VLLNGFTNTCRGKGERAKEGLVNSPVPARASLQGFGSQSVQGNQHYPTNYSPRGESLLPRTQACMASPRRRRTDTGLGLGLSIQILLRFIINQSIKGSPARAGDSSCRRTGRGCSQPLDSLGTVSPDLLLRRIGPSSIVGGARSDCRCLRRVRVPALQTVRGFRRCSHGNPRIMS
jgi:hypothetical protein